ncbi:MAG: sugar phosphate isomerase/epimerase [Opitutaceae bacterium]|jgi:sugar phosphate isomerase/epimerase
MQPHYRRALSTLGCPDLSLNDVLALAERHGIDAVELRTLEGTTDLPALFARSGEEALRRVQKLHGTVQVLAFSTSFKLVRPSDADRAALLSLVPWAEALGVPWLRAFDGGDSSDEGTVPLAAETLRWWRQLRSKNRWKTDIMVETHDGLVTQEAISRFCSEASGVAMLWDAHNTWRKTGIDPLAVWPHIAEHVVHIHVKDSVCSPSDGLPYSFVLPGEGEFPMKPLVSALKRSGYAHAISLEWERQWHPQLPPLEKALQTAAAHGWW